jgi:hypothetical protein
MMKQWGERGANGGTLVGGFSLTRYGRFGRHFGNLFLRLGEGPEYRRYSTMRLIMRARRYLSTFSLQGIKGSEEMALRVARPLQLHGEHRSPFAIKRVISEMAHSALFRTPPSYFSIAPRLSVSDGFHMVMFVDLSVCCECPLADALLIETMVLALPFVSIS